MVDKKLAFYIAKHGDIVDKLIAWWTAPLSMKFNKHFLELPSHVELVIEQKHNEDGSLCFSASGREKCVREKIINLDSGHWKIIDIPFELQRNIKLDNIYNENNKQYDYFGLFFYYIIPLKLQSDDKWWCSELCSYSLNFENYRMNPYELMKKIENY